jgi:hypothetical protein
MQGEPAQPYEEVEVNQDEEDERIPDEEPPIIGASLPPGFQPPNPVEELKMQMETLKDI